MKTDTSEPNTPNPIINVDCNYCGDTKLVPADREDVVCYLIVLRYGLKRYGIRQLREVIRQWRRDGRKLPCAACEVRPFTTPMLGLTWPQ